MGSGERFVYGRTHEAFGLGFCLCRMPFAITINLNVLLWYVQIGFGKGYDE